MGIGPPPIRATAACHPETFHRPPLPHFHTPLHRTVPPCRYAEQYSNDIADLLAPQSGAYYDVWLDGEKFFAHTMEVSGVMGRGEEGSVGGR